MHLPEDVPVVRLTGGRELAGQRPVRGRARVRPLHRQGGRILQRGGQGARERSVRGRLGQGAEQVPAVHIVSHAGAGEHDQVPAKPGDEERINLAVLFGRIAQVMSAVTTMILVVERLR